MHDSILKISAFCIGWSIAVLSTAYTLDGVFGTEFVSMLGKIPIIGVVFNYPMYFLVGIAGLFFLMYRGGAIPRFLYSMFRPRG